jgi:hypothetical protein
MEQNVYLAHHGIKGQKWGVRRFQNKDGSYTAEGRSRYLRDSEDSDKRNGVKDFYNKHKKAIKIGAAAVASAAVIYGSYKMYQTAPAKRIGALSYAKSDPLKSTLSNYGTKSITIPPGTKFYRISREAMEDYKSRGSAYVSYKLRDAAAYVSASQNKLSFPGGTRNFLHTMTSPDSVRVPSARDMAKIYLKQHPNASDQSFRMMFTYGFVQWDETDDPMVKVFKKEAESFKKALLAEGYNAILDLEDAGSSIEAPLILLSPSEMSVKSSEITQFERVVAGVMKRRPR